MVLCLRRRALLFVCLAAGCAEAPLVVDGAEIADIRGFAAVRVFVDDGESERQMVDFGFVLAPDDDLCARLQTVQAARDAEWDRWSDAQQQPWQSEPDWESVAWRRESCERQQAHASAEAVWRRDLGPDVGWTGVLRVVGDGFGAERYEPQPGVYGDIVDALGSLTGSFIVREANPWAPYADTPADCDTFAEADPWSLDGRWESVAFEPTNEELAEAEDWLGLEAGVAELDGDGDWHLRLQGDLRKGPRRAGTVELDASFEACELTTSRWGLAIPSLWQ